jgi:alpha-L-fucosidase 2
VAAAASAALARLRPLPPGEDGSILEWGRPFKEAEPGHRHFSPLYGLYPGSELPTEAVSAEICERFLDRRIEAGSGSTGWSASWAACLYARLGRAEKAYAMLRRAIGRFTLPSLLGNHPPFQIDANFGIGAAIMEMLFRDKKGFVVLLPALPSAWPEGELYGACLKGGFSLDMSWKNGILSGAKIAAHHEGSLELECAGARASLRLHAGQSVELGPNLALV